MCCGCMACINICSQNAIRINDNLDTYNAVINDDVCIRCNACKKICQVNNTPILSKPSYWYQGWANLEDTRSRSSSGGVAASISRTFILDGGCVCSCAFKNGQFKFYVAMTLDQSEDFSGSKYVKSNPDGIYEIIRTNLNSGKKVLFIGLPCQVAAVKNYIKFNENLYLIDLICHGTPSPNVLEYFLNDFNYSLNDFENIHFRKKTNFHINCNYKDLLPERVLDMYTYAFLEGLDYTENCYKCKYAQLERVSDLTLGDSWGSTLSLDEQEKGISLVLCQTEKGKELLEKTDLHLESVDLNRAMTVNKQLVHPTIMPKERKKFFAILKRKQKFSIAIFNCYPKVYFKQKLKLLLIRLKILGGGYKENGIAHYTLSVKLKDEKT